MLYRCKSKSKVFRVAVRVRTEKAWRFLPQLPSLYSITDVLDVALSNGLVLSSIHVKATCRTRALAPQTGLWDYESLTTQTIYRERLQEYDWRFLWG